MTIEWGEACFTGTYRLDSLAAVSMHCPSVDEERPPYYSFMCKSPFSITFAYDNKCNAHFIFHIQLHVRLSFLYTLYAYIYTHLSFLNIYIALRLCYAWNEYLRSVLEQLPSEGLVVNMPKIFTSLESESIPSIDECKNSCNSWNARLYELVTLCFKNHLKTSFFSIFFWRNIWMKLLWKKNRRVYHRRDYSTTISSYPIWSRFCIEYSNRFTICWIGFISSMRCPISVRNILLRKITFLFFLFSYDISYLVFSHSVFSHFYNLVVRMKLIFFLLALCWMTLINKVNSESIIWCIESAKCCSCDSKANFREGVSRLWAHSLGSFKHFSQRLHLM